MPVRRTELSVLIRVARQYLSVICAVAKEEPELQSSLLRILSPSKVANIFGSQSSSCPDRPHECKEFPCPSVRGGF
jgi:hypothetical protein